MGGKQCLLWICTGLYGIGQWQEMYPDEFHRPYLVYDVHGHIFLNRFYGCSLSFSVVFSTTLIRNPLPLIHCFQFPLRCQGYKKYWVEVFSAFSFSSSILSDGSSVVPSPSLGSNFPTEICHEKVKNLIHFFYQIKSRVHWKKSHIRRFLIILKGIDSISWSRNSPQN